MWQKLQTLDTTITHQLRIAEQPGPLRSLAAFLAHSGDSWFWFAGLIVVWFIGNEAWKYRAAVLAVGIFGTAVMVLALKFTIRRQRPAGEWGEVYRRSDPHSFPSGHAARAALLAVLGIGLGPAWFSLILLVWAPLVSLARVAMGVHYASDIAGGVVFGIASGLVTLMVLG
jgi:undecaprenyl-diphosphatase